jgi:hypothetical protein
MGGGIAKEAEKRTPIELEDAETEFLIRYVFRKFSGFDTFKSYLDREWKANSSGRDLAISLFQKLAEMFPSDDETAFDVTYERMIQIYIDHNNMDFLGTPTGASLQKVSVAVVLYLLRTKKENKGLLKHALRCYRKHATAEGIRQYSREEVRHVFQNRGLSHSLYAFLFCLYSTSPLSMIFPIRPLFGLTSSSLTSTS